MSEAQVVQGRRLAWNTLLNLTTGSLLLGLNLLFVPLMLRSFGTELYGVLTVTWMVLAQLGWLDFGLSRASAKYVAHALAEGRPDTAALWGWTAILTQTILGLFGALLLWLFAPMLVDLLHVQPERAKLVVLTLRLFAFALPLELAARSMNGILQARQRFDWINALSLLSFLWTYAVYTIGILRGGDFLVIIYGLFALRIVSLAASAWCAIFVLPSLKSTPRQELFLWNYWPRAKEMLRFGGWVSVAAMIGPFLIYFDQWSISLLLGVAVLPFYAVPFNLLARLNVVPSSLTATLFPAFSAMQAKSERMRLEGYFVRSHRYLLIALIPLLFVLFVWAPAILRVWLGEEFASAAALPLRILTLGFGIALLAPLSGTLLQAVGRPDLLAKLYVIELPINILLVLFLTRNFGIVGAAASYALRATVETVMLWLLVYRSLPISGASVFRGDMLRMGSTLLGVGGITGLLVLAPIQVDIAIAGTLLTLAAYGIIASVFLLDDRDWSLIRSLVSKPPR